MFHPKLKSFSFVWLVFVIQAIFFTSSLMASPTQSSVNKLAIKKLWPTSVSRIVTLNGLFGDGRNNSHTVGNGQTFIPNLFHTTLSSSASAGSNQICLVTPAGFFVGDEILIIQARGTGAGNYEFNVITGTPSCLTLAMPLEHTYTIDGHSAAQVVKVVQFENLTVQTGGVLTADPWVESPGHGGIVVLRVNDTLQVDAGGLIHANYIGFFGGSQTPPNPEAHYGNRGEGSGGMRDIRTHLRNGSGGGGGQEFNNNGGGGGGHGTAGSPGYNNVAEGGAVVGDNFLSTIHFGGAGGGAAAGGDGNEWGSRGGRGGGIIIIFAREFVVNGSIEARGEAGVGTSQHFGGGGGAGGTIFGVAQNMPTTPTINISGGNGGGPNRPGGAGGSGRSRFESCNTFGNIYVQCLTVEIDESGIGSVNTLPTEIDCGLTCIGAFATSTPITLTATPATGYSFSHWSGYVTGSVNPVTLNLTSNQQVTAFFELNTYVITPTAGVNGSITPNTPQTVTHGDSVAFTITPATGYHVADVVVDGSSIGAVEAYTFTNVITNHLISASFTINSYDLTVNKAGNGFGTVSSDPAGINCGITCVISATHGTEITLTTTVEPGSIFTGWSGACTGTNSCVVTLEQAENVTATFSTHQLFLPVLFRP